MKRFGIVMTAVVLAGASWAGAVNWGKAKRVVKKKLANVPTTRTPSKKDGLRVVGLSVALPDPNNKAGMSLAGNLSVGTKIHFTLVRKDRVIVRIDKKAGKLTVFADDKGKSLIRKKKWGRGDFGSFPKISKDGHRLKFSVTTEKTPTPKARNIRVKGHVVVQCGSNEKTGSQKNVALTKGTAVSIGPLVGKITNAGKPEWGGGDSKFQVSIESTADAFARVKVLKAIGADGKPIECRPSGWSQGGASRTQNYGLKKKVAKATIRLTYFDKTEMLRVPIDHTLGVGL